MFNNFSEQEYSVTTTLTFFEAKLIGTGTQIFLYRVKIQCFDNMGLIEIAL